MNEAEQALNTLYAVARHALVNGDTGDQRDQAAQIIQKYLQERVEIEEELMRLKQEISENSNLDK